VVEDLLPFHLGCVGCQSIFRVEVVVSDVKQFALPLEPPSTSPEPSQPESNLVPLSRRRAFTEQDDDFKSVKRRSIPVATLLMLIMVLTLAGASTLTYRLISKPIAPADPADTAQVDQNKEKDSARTTDRNQPPTTDVPNNQAPPADGPQPDRVPRQDEPKNNPVDPPVQMNPPLLFPNDPDMDFLPPMVFPQGPMPVFPNPFPFPNIGQLPPNMGREQLMKLQEMLKQREQMINQQLEINPFGPQPRQDFAIIGPAPQIGFKGGLFTHPIFTTATPRDKLTFKLESAPEGMKISPEGIITWRIPKESTEVFASATVKITNSSGQTITHRIAFPLQ
jgi:hypothetical protein